MQKVPITTSYLLVGSSSSSLPFSYLHLPSFWPLFFYNWLVWIKVLIMEFCDRIVHKCYTLSSWLEKLKTRQKTKDRHISNSIYQDKKLMRLTLYPEINLAQYPRVFLGQNYVWHNIMFSTFVCCVLQVD